MFDVEYLYKFLQMNRSNEPDDERCLDKTLLLKFILTTVRCFNDLTALYTKMYLPYCNS